MVRSEVTGGLNSRMRYADFARLDEKFHMRGPDMKLIQVHDTLNPILWDQDEQLRPEIRSILMKIVNEFFRMVGVNWKKNPQVVRDIVLIGSNCNYNYGPASDIDIHVITDFRALVKNNDSNVMNFVRNTLRAAQRDFKNKQLSYQGIPIEIVIEEEGVPNQNSAAIYSLMRNEWERRPVRPDKKQFDLKNPELRAKVKACYVRWRDMIDRAIESNDIRVLLTTVRKLVAERREALERDGDGAPENQAYKILRDPKNSHLQHLWDKINDLTEKDLLTPDANG